MAGGRSPARPEPFTDGLASFPSAQHNTPTPLIDALLKVRKPVVAEVDFVLALPAEMFLLTPC